MAGPRGAVGPVDRAVGGDDYVVGRPDLHAAEVGGERGYGAVGLLSPHASAGPSGRHQASLPVVGQTVGLARRSDEHLGARLRRPFPDGVARYVREQQVAPGRVPHRTLGEQVVRGDQLDRGVARHEPVELRRRGDDVRHRPPADGRSPAAGCTEAPRSPRQTSAACRRALPGRGVHRGAEESTSDTGRLSGEELREDVRGPRRYELDHTGAPGVDGGDGPLKRGPDLLGVFDPLRLGAQRPRQRREIFAARPPDRAERGVEAPASRHLAQPVQ